MSYFSVSYKALSYPIATKEAKGLRNAQIGAIHSIVSHFTIHEKEPAIVVMPTGSGKTGVLFLSAFALRANRVLIITPSKLVRNQIALGFETLDILIQTGALPGDIKKPKVKEITSVLESQDKWDALSEYDVVISTPNSLPINSWQVNPEQKFFDLVLIDEAHHSPAHTWNSLLRHFSTSKKILFTGTPFRRDKKEIKGSFIYNYPISKAFEDEIFGSVDFIAVNPDAHYSNDISLAKEAERTFLKDKKAGYEHCILVRIDTKIHSKDLLNIYEKNTNLKLKRIDSSFSSKQIEIILEQLKTQILDGIICVDMLGEGFDFPNLKIGVIHNPHKSLAITLQFIGRFARTNKSKIGAAKFLAIPNEINFLKLELYQEGAIWKDIIKEISQNTIENEIEVRKTLQNFIPQSVEFEDDRDISLYSLKPFFHVKIYEVPKSFDIATQVTIPDNNIDKHYVSKDLSVAVYITKEIKKPKWLATEDVLNVNFNLFIIYYDVENNLLYLNSTKKSVDVYQQIAEQYIGENPQQLPFSLVRKVIADLANPEVFNLGLRSKNTINNAESYIIKAGSHVQNAIKPNEIKLYEGGHLFLRGQENGDYKTIGYSSSSKVWSNATAKITDFVKWCSKLSARINSTKDFKTNTDLDRISFRKVINRIPEKVIFASWDSLCYKNDYQYYYNNNGVSYDGMLVDLEINIINSNNREIQFSIANEDFSELYNFSLDEFFKPLDEKKFLNLFIVTQDAETIELSRFLHEYPLTFYFQDFASLRLNEISDPILSSNITFDINKISVLDWNDTDIECEFSGNQQGKRTIHAKIQDFLLERSSNILLYDHGAGEIADFIFIKENTNSILVELYHCKGSGGEDTGNRVEDVYEVCGQSVKSCIWTNSQVLKNKIHKRLNRKNPSTFLVGNVSELNRLYTLEKIFQYKIVAVQPGILKSNIAINISEILAAAESYIENGDAMKFNLLTS